MKDTNVSDNQICNENMAHFEKYNRIVQIHT